MDDIKAYVENYLRRELDDFQKKGLGKNLPELNLWEMVLVYKYSLDGYEGLNEALRSGRTHPMEELLNKLLDKLPDYEGLVFRGEEMSSYRKDFFQEVLANKVSLEEPAFLSTTRSEQIAQMFSRGDTVFRIASFSGKSIEAVAFHGLGSPMNEREVLFKSKTRFRVLAIELEQGKTYITLIEAPSA